MNFPRWQPSRHLGFCQTENSAIRSADPENPTVEPNMKCIGRPLTEIWPFEIFPNERSVVGHRSVLNIQGGQETGLFLRVNNFATVSGTSACGMSKFSKFYLVKNTKRAYQCVKYDFLLVVYSNFCRITHRFGEI